MARTSGRAAIARCRRRTTRRRHSLRRNTGSFYWSMIFSDLPSPAEASSQNDGPCEGLRAGGKPVPTPDHQASKATPSSTAMSGAGFFGIMLSVDFYVGRLDDLAPTLDLLAHVGGGSLRRAADHLGRELA